MVVQVDRLLVLVDRLLVLVDRPLVLVDRPLVLVDRPLGHRKIYITNYSKHNSVKRVSISSPVFFIKIPRKKSKKHPILNR